MTHSTKKLGRVSARSKIEKLAAGHKGKIVFFSDSGKVTVVFPSTSSACMFLIEASHEFYANRVGAEVRMMWNT